MEEMYCRTHDVNSVRVFSERDVFYGTFTVMTVEEAIRKYGDKIRYLYGEQDIEDWSGGLLTVR